MRDIFDIIRRLWREICCIFLLTFLIYSSYIWFAETPENQYRAIMLFVTNAVELYLLFRLLLALWRLKWRPVAAKGAQRLFAAAARVFSYLFDNYISRWFGSKAPKNLISGSSKITLDRITFEKKPIRKKTAKWKHLETDRQRLAFLYRHMITAKLRAGATAFPQDTPSEIKKKSENSPAEETLFDVYISSRYDERIIPDHNIIEKLKNEFEIK